MYCFRRRSARVLALALLRPRVLVGMLTIVGLYRLLSQLDQLMSPDDLSQRDDDAGSASSPNDRIHVLLASDDADLRPAAVAIRSALDAAAEPGRLLFHFFTTPELAPVVEDLFKEHLGFAQVVVHHDVVLQERLEGLQLAQLPSSAQRALAFDFSPYFAAELLAKGADAGIDRVIYLRTDTVILGDLAEIGGADMMGRAVGAVRSCAQHFEDIMNISALVEIGVTTLDAKRCVPSDALLAFDLPTWRRAGITDRLQKWLVANRDARSPLWSSGAALPALILAVSGRLGDFGNEWALCGDLARPAATPQEVTAVQRLGLERSSLRQLERGNLGRPRIVSCSRTANLLQFVGDLKPWLLDVEEDASLVPACSLPKRLSLLDWGWSVIVRFLCEGVPVVSCADIWSAFISPETACAMKDFDKEWRDDEVTWLNRRRELEHEFGLDRSAG